MAKAATTEVISPEKYLEAHREELLRLQKEHPQLLIAMSRIAYDWLTPMVMSDVAENRNGRKNVLLEAVDAGVSLSDLHEFLIKNAPKTEKENLVAELQAALSAAGESIDVSVSVKDLLENISTWEKLIAIYQTKAESSERDEKIATAQKILALTKKLYDFHMDSLNKQKQQIKNSVRTQPLQTTPTKKYVHHPASQMLKNIEEAFKEKDQAKKQDVLDEGWMWLSASSPDYDLTGGLINQIKTKLAILQLLLV
jgi:hypothetical protein